MDLLMPPLGASVDKGTISNWLKSVGDSVAAGEPLFEVETDKTTLEIEAARDGVLVEIRVGQGEEADSGMTVGILQVAGEEVTERSQEPVPSKPPVALKQAGSAAPVAGVSQAGPVKMTDPFDPGPARVNFGLATLPDGRKISPLARRLAVQQAVDVTSLSGSGPNGRIVAADIRNGAQPPVTPVAPSITNFSAYADVPSREIALDRMRAVIAERLTAAKREVPHFYIATDIEIDRLLKLRADLQEAHDTKITINDFLITAMARAIRRVPAANMIWADDRLLQFDRVDLGVAVAVPGGLITPVIRSADTKSLVTIAREARELAARARDHRLAPGEYSGGVATLSNLGMYGVGRAQAIINPPQSVIAAVGAAERWAKETEDQQVRFVTRIAVSLSVDHRVVDGATASEVLGIMKKSIENPLSLVG